LPGENDPSTGTVASVASDSGNSTVPSVTVVSSVSVAVLVLIVLAVIFYRSWNKSNKNSVSDLKSAVGSNSSNKRSDVDKPVALKLKSKTTSSNPCLQLFSARSTKDRLIQHTIVMSKLASEGPEFSDVNECGFITPKPGPNDVECFENENISTRKALSEHELPSKTSSLGNSGSSDSITSVKSQEQSPPSHSTHSPKRPTKLFETRKTGMRVYVDWVDVSPSPTRSTDASTQRDSPVARSGSDNLVLFDSEMENQKSPSPQARITSSMEEGTTKLKTKSRTERKGALIDDTGETGTRDAKRSTPISIVNI